MLIERKKCPACTSLTFREIYRESYNKGAIKEYCIDKRYDLDILKDFYYDLLECKNCGLLYQRNIPNNELLDLIYNKWLSQNKADIYIIACFSDPGLDQIKKMTNSKVIGIAEASYKKSIDLNSKFGIISILENSIIRHEKYLKK